MKFNHIADKAFSNPQFYREQLIKSNLVEGNPDWFSGKTFICVSLTRFCPVGCKFCFFRSGTAFRKATPEDIMTTEGVKKLINFANNINLGYLLVSGGGEPMMEKDSILEIIQHVKSERIVLVTSAYWAKKMVSAEKYLESIQEALTKRTTQTSVTIRVSVDLEHTNPLGLEPIINLIELFSKKYQFTPQLDLQIHSLDGDPSVVNLIERCQTNYKITREAISEQRISDGKNVIKIVPKQEIIKFNNLALKVGYAKAFYSDLRVNLNDPSVILRNIEIYQKDLFESEDGNSSIVTNKLGNPGLDFWVNYNGNVTTWGNQYLDNLFNLYTDSYREIINATLSDPAALAFIEKGANYRDGVVSEANKVAVLRSKAVNIRDYTGALMFDEARTRLYYTIRSLQDYIAEGRIKENALKWLPPELYELLSTEKAILIEAYKSTNYTIVQQTIEEASDSAKVLDILEWIKLGHYSLEQRDINRLIEFYNRNVPDAEKIDNIFATLPHSLKMQIVRMTQHLTHMKPEALKMQAVRKQELVA